MRTSLIFSLIGISLLCFLLSCGKRAGSIPAELARADSLLAVCPDSAARYLASLDSLVREEPERVRMYYALQKIKADDKCYVTHTTDSVIRAVVRYYTDAGDPDLLMEAYYYLGSVYRDMGDAPRAVEAFQKAVDIGQESGSERYDLLGRSYEQIGYRLAYQGLYNEALEAYKKSYDYNVDRPKGKIYALRNIARMYNAINEVDSAICYYMRAYEGMRFDGDSSMKDNVLSELSAVYIRKKEYGKAKGVFNLISNQDDVNIYWGLGSIYRDSMRLDSAIYYFKKANACGNIYMRHNCHFILSELERKKGNYRIALDYALECIYIADSMDNITRTEAVAKVHSLYNYQHTEKENNRLRMENDQKEIRNYQLLLGIILLVVGSSCFVFYLNSRRRKAIEKEKRLRELGEERYARSMDRIHANERQIAELEILLRQAESQKDNLRKQLIQSQKEQLELSNREILASRSEKDILDVALRKSDIYRLFHEAGERMDIRITDKEWDELRDAIDVAYSNFTARLYALCPRISKQELYICYLIKISVPVKGIAQIVGRSTSAITAARIRLYKKIHGTEGTADKMDRLIIDM